jgi:glucan phosphorylase
MTNEDVKRVYYMSLEFLIGRAMQNSLINLRVE